MKISSGKSSTNTSRVSWSELRRQLRAAKADILRQQKERRGGAENYVYSEFVCDGPKGVGEPFTILVIGTYDYLWQHRDTNLRAFPVVIGTRSDIERGYGPKFREVIVLPMLRKQAPLRLIVARYPEALHVNEKLECGHWHTYYGPSWETRSKRRRCHECLHPKKPAGSSWSLEGGTAGQYQWSIQRKGRVIL